MVVPVDDGSIGPADLDDERPVGRGRDDGQRHVWQMLAVMREWIYESGR
jgi:hypothetical protein